MAAASSARWRALCSVRELKGDRDGEIAGARGSAGLDGEGRNVGHAVEALDGFDNRAVKDTVNGQNHEGSRDTHS
jgi:hypothetical protein